METRIRFGVRFSTWVCILVLVVSLPNSWREARAEFVVSGAEQISVGAGGKAPSGFSSDPVTPPNGNSMVFTSAADNLINGDTNKLSDVFQYTQESGLQLISASAVTGSFPGPGGRAFGASGAAISNALPDGTYAVVFTSDSTDMVANYQAPPGVRNPRQVYLRLPKTSQTFLISRSVDSTDQALGGADHDCDQLSVVALADPTRFTIAFRSSSGNLDASYTGAQGFKTIFVVTVSVSATGLVFLERKAASQLPNGNPLDADIHSLTLSGDGRFVVFSSTGSFGDFQSTGKEQVFLLERGTPTIKHITRNPLGAPGNDDSYSPSISFQGEAISFITKASDLIPRLSNNPVAMVFSSRTGAMKQINSNALSAPSDGDAFGVRVSPGGKLVVFSDNGSNLVSGSTPAGVVQTYIKSIDSGDIARVSISSNGTAGDGNSGTPPNNQGKSDPAPALAFGSIGFNSPLVFAAFRSEAPSLTTYGTSSATFPNVFRTSVAPPKPKFEKGTPIEAPPDITITKSLPGGKGASVKIELQEFTASTASAVYRDDVSALASSKTKLTYDLKIKKTGSSLRINKILSRNTTTIRKLSPGRYTVRYRVIKTTGKQVSRTGFSPTTAIEIT